LLESLAYGAFLLDGDLTCRVRGIIIHRFVLDRDGVDRNAFLLKALQRFQEVSSIFGGVAVEIALAVSQPGRWRPWENMNLDMGIDIVDIIEYREDGIRRAYGELTEVVISFVVIEAVVCGGEI